MKKIISIITGVLAVTMLMGCNTNTVTSGINQENEGTTINQDSENKVSENNTNTDVTDPKDSLEFKTVNLGENLSLDFLEMTFDAVSSAEELKPTDTDGVYSYKSDTENEKYFYLQGTMKNIGGNSYDVEDVVAEIVFDDKYTYTAWIAADDGGNDFYGSSVKPFGSVKYYLYSSVPDELLNQYSSVTFKLGFKENFSGSYYDDFDECDYLYQLTAVK